jgi:hypothetical protein
VLRLGLVRLCHLLFIGACFGLLAVLRVSRDREHGFHCIMSKYFAGS